MITLKKEQIASAGIAMGQIFFLNQSNSNLDVKESLIPMNERKRHLEKFLQASALAIDELDELSRQNEIFAAQREIAKDETLLNSVKSNILGKGFSASSALNLTIKEQLQIFENLSNTYLQERAADIKDIGNRIMGHLCGSRNNPFEGIGDGDIIVAHELFPSDLARIDLDKIGGFVISTGGITSHFSILSRNLSITATVGLGTEVETLKNADFVILDTLSGKIIINPDKKEIKRYSERIIHEKEEKEKLELKRHEIARTSEGEIINVMANVGSVNEVKLAMENGAEGVGLFRSEFLFMSSSDFPDEDIQFEIYKKSAKLCKGKPLTIRTLDIGGDKPLPYYTMDAEENPALGLRGIRFSLAQPSIFKTQICALLRASIYGDVRIMLPMVISTQEVEEALQLINECKSDLDQRELKYNKDVKVGIMIETPAAVLMAKELAEQCDFFSIGTNDLTQYILAADRGNTLINHLYSSTNKAIIVAIQMIMSVGQQKNIEVEMCGELASDIESTSLLLEMGLVNFSVSIGTITKLKEEIRKY